MQSAALDLSDCELMAVPDAIFFIMKAVRAAQFTCATDSRQNAPEIRRVQLSGNVLKKVPAKLTIFSLITGADLAPRGHTHIAPELHLANNMLATLPDAFGSQ